MDKKIKVKYALEFAKLSYSLEEKRETKLIVSFISSVLSQRRIPYETMLIGDEFEEYLEKYKDDYNDESDYEEQMIIQLSNVQKSKKNNNDKRVFWVQQSTFFLYYLHSPSSC